MDQFCFYVFKLLNYVSYNCVFFHWFRFAMISSVMYIVVFQACQFKCSYDFSFFVFSVLSLGYCSVVALFCRSGCLYALCFWVLFNFLENNVRNMIWVFVYLDFGFVGFCFFQYDILDSPSRPLQMQGEKQKEIFCVAMEFCFA